MNKKEQKKQLSAPKWLSHIQTQKKRGGGKYTIKKSREKREKKGGKKEKHTQRRDNSECEDNESVYFSFPFGVVAKLKRRYERGKLKGRARTHTHTTTILKRKQKACFFL